MQSQIDLYEKTRNKMGAAKVRLDSESSVNTMDFVNKIVNGGDTNNKRTDYIPQ